MPERITAAPARPAAPIEPPSVPSRAASEPAPGAGSTPRAVGDAAPGAGDEPAARGGPPRAPDSTAGGPDGATAARAASGSTMREPDGEGGRPAGAQVASIPPHRTEPPPVDIRSALRRGGGAGGPGAGRGGIEGESIELDSSDPNFREYLDRVRRQIKQKWGYPCLPNPATRRCEYKTATLVVEFGVLRAGRVQFVDVKRSSGFPIYDDYAVNAIKLGSPFPPVPEAMMARMKPGSAGVSIVAIFNYVVDTSLTNLLR